MGTVSGILPRLGIADLSFQETSTAIVFPGNQAAPALMRRTRRGSEHSRVAFAEQRPPSPWLLTFEMSGTSFRQQQLGLKSFEALCPAPVNCADSALQKHLPLLGFSFPLHLPRISAFSTSFSHAALVIAGFNNPDYGQPHFYSFFSVNFSSI